MNRCQFNVYRAVLAIGVGLSVSSGSAELRAAEIRAQVDRTSPQVADPFWLTLMVRVDEGSEVVFPSVPDSIGTLNVLGHRDWFDIPAGTQREWTRHFKLDSLQGGEFEISALSVVVDGQTLTSQPITVSVQSDLEVDSDPIAFRDIQPQIDIPPPPIRQASNTLWIVLGAVGLLAAIAAVVLMRRPRPLQPGRWALKQLDAIHDSEAYRAHAATELIPAIAAVLREFIQRQLDIQATRQTTAEFLLQAQQDPRLTEPQRALLQKFLSHVDEVKFAHRQPEQGRLEDSYRLVREFVRTTSGETQKTGEAQRTSGEVHLH